LPKFIVLMSIFIAACGPAKKPDGGGGPDAAGGDDDGTCASSTTKADQVPLDIYIMLDQSGSMSETVAGGGTKWQATTNALTAFVHQMSLDGVGVGLGYFGVPPNNTCGVPFCTKDADCGAGCGPCNIVIPGVPGGCGGFNPGGGDSCSANDYAVPAVEIATLPGVATPITSSMSTHGPNTGTPTSAALQGAIDHAKTWATAHPGHAVVAVLATDGDPADCDTDLNHINAIAAAGASSAPKILTFVIGVGNSLGALNGIAAAGGTTKAFLVDTGGNVNQQIVDAMNAIRHAALGCAYTIPAPTTGTADYSKVNVVYTPGNGGPPQTIPQVMNKAACPATGNAWYYDDPNHPTQILLCDATCASIEADMTGKVDIALGCGTVIL
jgi:hypothetical protein